MRLSSYGYLRKVRDATVGSIYHFLISGMKPSDPTTLRTLVLANALLFIAGIACFSGFLYNLNYNHWLATFNIIVSLVSLFAIIDLRKNQNIQRAVNVGAVMLFFFFIAFTYTNESSDFGLIWTIFFPIFVITLVGHKKGLMLTGLFYLIILSMAYHKIGVWDHGAWSLRGFIRLTVASFVLTYIVYVYESFIYHTNIELQYTREKEVQYLEELRMLSVSDPLTGLYNRRRMNDAIQEQVDGFKNHKEHFSLIIFDIDNFKSINDHFGHNIGDRVLVMIAAISKKILRKTGHISRWGGEEFLVLLPKTAIEETMIIAEKLRQEIESGIYPHHSCVTCSIGVAEYNDLLDMESIINQADRALYQAKNSGKNRVCRL